MDFQQIFKVLWDFLLSILKAIPMLWQWIGQTHKIGGISFFGVELVKPFDINLLNGGGVLIIAILVVMLVALFWPSN